MAQAASLIRLSVEKNSQGERLRLCMYNSAGTWLAGDALLWPDRSFCADLLQRHGGMLSEQRMDGHILLHLDLPCRVSVA